MTLFLIFISFSLTVAGVLIFRRLASRTTRLLDVPNERSSHETPVTRGAGIAIVVTVLGLYVAISAPNVNLYFVFAGLSIATVSFLDDLFTMSPTLRLAIHIAAASLLVYSSGPYDGLGLESLFDDRYGIVAPFLSIVFIVWTINVFNFMDGIDGIAGVQGAGAGLGWMLIGMGIGSNIYTGLGAVILGACVGFLLFNWQPAKVFMGDVGSTFLGFTLSVFPLIHQNPQISANYSQFSVVFLLLWLFQFDAGLIRAKQVLSGKAFWRPHREHMYQRLVIGGNSHATVAAYFGFFAILAALTVYIVPMVGPWPAIAAAGIGAVGLLFWSGKKIDVKVE